MLEGNIFLADTGTPILKMDFANKVFALADPVPLTFANRTTKSFTPPLDDIHGKLWSYYKRIFAYPTPRLDIAQRKGHNEGRRLRLSPSRGSLEEYQKHISPAFYLMPAWLASSANHLLHHSR